MGGDGAAALEGRHGELPTELGSSSQKWWNLARVPPNYAIGQIWEANIGSSTDISRARRT